MPLHAPLPDDEHRKRTFEWLLFAVAIFFILIAARLWYLQVIKADHFELLAQRNRTRYIPIAAPRGIIFDRNGEILVGNRPSFSVSVLRQDVTDKVTLIEDIAEILACDTDEIEKNWEKYKYFPQYSPIPLKIGITRGQVEQLSENSMYLPGMIIETRPVRSYPSDSAGAHIFGHVGLISAEELASKQGDSNYRAGDLIGKGGLEKYLNSTLRGNDGQLVVEVDVKGKLLRQRVKRQPTPGQNLVLTLDKNLQQCAQKELDGMAGAAVVLDVTNGQILALASSPTYDPDIFTDGISTSEWFELLNNPRTPLQNRAISGQYPPGSTFKPVIALLAASHPEISHTQQPIICEGKTRIGNRDFRCWKRIGHGSTNLNKAMRESCDVWFYHMSMRLGIDRLADMARNLGLGSRYNLPLDSEQEGLIPDRAWKRGRFNEAWYMGETAITGIGQGYVLTTPLQLALMTATIANGGTLYRPQILKNITSHTGEMDTEIKAEVLHQSNIPAGAIAQVKASLEAVVHDPRGTGTSCRIEGLRIAGKTGTAQVVRLADEDEKGISKEEIAYRHRDHALFIAYAPADNPQIATAVIVEHGEHASKTAIPVTRALLMEYFNTEKSGAATK
ncbi:MAG: penicillin-binding protein 2 [Desulfuromonadaceae bacterium]|nr:penicillin-binding protein 2 [Desulfuromonadaceae bacterium]